jgi:hypothetical protein
MVSLLGSLSLSIRTPYIDCEYSVYLVEFCRDRMHSNAKENESTNHIHLNSPRRGRVLRKIAEVGPEPGPGSGPGQDFRLGC